MWIGIPTTSTSQIRSIPHFPSLAASASTPKSNPPSISSSSSSGQLNLKTLGHAVLNLTTSHKSILRDNESAQLSGSDILLAIQQADLRKRNKNKKKTKGKKVSSLAGQSDDDGGGGGGGVVEETSGVKPLMIKSDWGKKIEDLERRLREIAEF